LFKWYFAAGINRDDDVVDAGSSNSGLDQVVPADDEYSESESGGVRRPQPSVTADDRDIAERVDICSTSKCGNCQNLLYDEEIMAGWSLDDSNYNTRYCHFFKRYVSVFVYLDLLFF